MSPVACNPPPTHTTYSQAPLRAPTSFSEQTHHFPRFLHCLLLISKSIPTKSEIFFFFFFFLTAQGGGSFDELLHFSFFFAHGKKFIYSSFSHNILIKTQQLSIETVNNLGPVCVVFLAMYQNHQPTSKPTVSWLSSWKFRTQVTKTEQFVWPCWHDSSVDGAVGRCHWSIHYFGLNKYKVNCNEILCTWGHNLFL